MNLLTCSSKLTQVCSYLLFDERFHSFNVTPALETSAGHLENSNLTAWGKEDSVKASAGKLTRYRKMKEFLLQVGSHKSINRGF